METIVFTNGCFDLIHPGHIDLLRRARRLGSKLIVGINSDASIRKIKGKERPFLDQNDRREILLGLKYVDDVRIFDELTPEKLINEIKPDILVKGGDWQENEIIGSAFVKKNGGEVRTIPLIEGYSTTNLAEKIRGSGGSPPKIPKAASSQTEKIKNTLNAHIELFKEILNDQIGAIESGAELIYETLKKGNKILICGNGGSAADAQHIAAEFVGRYETERIALPAIALTTDTSALTAITNDYDFEKVFSRQIQALAKPGDLLIAVSTSGNSPNIIHAVLTAREIGCAILGMTGAKGKKLASLADECLLIPSERTARIQEAHITVAHIWCEIIDGKYSVANNAVYSK